MSEQKINTKNSRVIGIDLLRAFSALMIFLSHSARQYPPMTYSVFTTFFERSVFFMIVFFMLSGFSLYYAYGNRDFAKLDDLKKFYWKRFISIYPVYIACYVLWLIVYCKYYGVSLTDNLLMAPVELLLLQSTLDGSFGMLHNGGTWFISCFVICWFVFPFIASIIRQMTVKGKAILTIMTWFVLGLVPVLVIRYGFSSVYANPFYRLLEFLMGMLICDYFMKRKEKPKKHIGIKICFVMSVFVVYITWLYNVYAGLITNIFMNYIYTHVLVALFGILVYLFACYEPKSFFKKVWECRIVQYFSNLSYTFFFTQLFTFNVLKMLQMKTNWFVSHGNIKSIVISFSMCLIGAVLLHELIEKPFKKLLGRKKFK